MNKPFFNNNLTYFLAATLIIGILFLIHTGLPQLTSTFDYQQAKFNYTHSQFNLDNAEFLGNIDDDELYTYAGISYLRGADPGSINPETPFLIKYSYGLSYLVFGNSIVIQFIFAISLLLGLSVLTFQTTLNSSLSLLAPILLSLDPLFTHQTFTSILDLPHALLIILTLIFFLHHQTNLNPAWLYLSAIALAGVATTKFLVSAVIIFLPLAVLLRKTPKSLIQFTLASAATYLIIHLPFFAHHTDLLDFAKLHLNTFRLYRSYLPDYPWGELLRIIYLGRWNTWWGEGIIPSPFWSVFWPLGTTSLFSSLYFSWRHRYPSMLLIATISLLYLASNLIHVVFPRYLLSVLPLCYLSLLYSFQEVIHASSHRRQRSQHQQPSRE